MYTGLKHSHEGLAYLFLLSTTISVLLALITYFGGPKPALIKVGTILARIVETSLGGLLGLMGIVMWFMLPWPMSAPWLWIGLVAVIGSGGIIGRGIKPALASLKTGDDAMKGRWLSMALIHWLLIIFAFAAMHVKLGGA